MPRLNDYLTELQIGKSPETETIFNFALTQIYSKEYLNKIENKIKGIVKIKDKVNNNTNVVAWNKGTTIYVNKPVFYSKSRALQVQYLLHEFVHVLHHARGFLAFRKFKEIKSLSSKLWKIANKHSKNVGMFLTGKNADKKYLNPEETLAYFMNGKIKWNQISPEGKTLFVQELKNANMFNLSSAFWKARLS